MLFNLKKSLENVLNTNATVVFSDKLKNYKSFIPVCIHKTVRFWTKYRKGKPKLRMHVKR